MTDRPAKSALPPASPEQAERLHIFAHDIKNRLSGLWEVIRSLRSDPIDSPTADELFAFAERGYFKAQSDVEALLDDLSVDRRIAVRDLAPFDVVACVNSAITQETYRLNKKDQRVDLDVRTACTALGDERWTTQIIQALLSNASKFSPKQAAISVLIDQGEGTIDVTVKDHGIGLSPEDMEQLFTRYAVLTSRSTDGEPQARGTLARARQWAEAQGGSIHATSDGHGHGAVFTLALPAQS